MPAPGIMQVLTERHSYLLPPQCALWIPPGVQHTAFSEQALAFRGLYLDAAVLPGARRDCAVLQVTPLVRELIERVSHFPADYPDDGPQARLLQVLVDELQGLAEAPFSLPLPSGPAPAPDHRCTAGRAWGQPHHRAMGAAGGGIAAHPGAPVSGADPAFIP